VINEEDICEVFLWVEEDAYYLFGDKMPTLRGKINTKINPFYRMERIINNSLIMTMD
jgi:hypothetical protein